MIHPVSYPLVLFLACPAPEGSAKSRLAASVPIPHCWRIGNVQGSEYGDDGTCRQQIQRGQWLLAIPPASGSCPGRESVKVPGCQILPVSYKVPQVLHHRTLSPHRLLRFVTDECLRLLPVTSVHEKTTRSSQIASRGLMALQPGGSSTLSDNVATFVLSLMLDVNTVGRLIVRSPFRVARPTY